MTDTSARVVLVKPGDILIIGNIGTLDDEAIATAGEAVSRLHTQLGLAGVVLFEGDIDLATVAQSALDTREQSRQAARQDSES